MIIKKKYNYLIFQIIGLIILITGIVLTFIVPLDTASYVMGSIFLLATLIIIISIVRFIIYPKMIMEISDDKIILYPNTKKEKILNMDGIHGIYYYANISLFIKSNTGTLTFYYYDESLRIPLVYMPKLVKEYIDEIIRLN